MACIDKLSFLSRTLTEEAIIKITANTHTSQDALLLMF